MIDAVKLKSLNYAREHWLPLRDDGKPVSPATVNRWALKGLNGIKLQVVKAGRRQMTSQQWCNEFFGALAESGTDDGVIAVEESELAERGLL